MDDNKKLDLPKVSVIIPVYGVEKYLPACIDSILTQTYRNLEIFLVNDGSPDHCPAICDAYAQKDRRIHVIHKENGGQATARNAALDVCTGNYISFVDSDDRVKPDFIEKMVAALDKHNADLAVCGFLVNSGVRIAKSNNPPAVKVYESAEQLLQDYVSTPYIFTGPCNKLYKRTLFDGIRFPAIRMHEDAYIMHEVIAKAQKAVHIAECLYIQNIREGSTENKPFQDNDLLLLDCADRLQQFINHNAPALYPLVATKKVDDIMYLLRKVAKSQRNNDQRRIYSRLVDLLTREIDKNKHIYSKQYVNKVERYTWIVRHAGFFRLYCQFCVLHAKTRQHVKNIIIKIKSKIK